MLMPSRRVFAAPVVLLVAAACVSDKVCTEQDLGTEWCDPTRVNTRGWEDSPFMSADGQRLFFMYSTYSFMPIFRLGLPERRGPERDGFVPRDNPFDEANVYVATRLPDGAGWSTPEWLSLNQDLGACCLMTNDERRFYYQRGAEGRDSELATIDVDDEGVPSEPTLHTAASSPTLEDNPHASADDQVVWFTSDRPGGAGGKDLWVSVRGSEGALAPATSVVSLNSAEDEDQIWVRPDGRVAFFNRGLGIFRSERSDASVLAADNWGPATEVLFDDEPADGGEASLTADEERLVFARVDRELDDIVIVEARRSAAGRYDAPVPVD